MKNRFDYLLLRVDNNGYHLYSNNSKRPLNFKMIN